MLPFLVTLLLPPVFGLITWPIYTEIGLQAEALNNLTGNRNVYATCDYVIFTEHVNFDEAEDRCRAVNMGMTSTTGWGRLATVDGEQKNLELSDLMKVAFGASVGPELGGKYNATNWLWVGLRKVNNLLNEDGTMTYAEMKKAAKKMKGSKSPAEDWEWEDSLPADPDWMNWDNDQPDQAPDTDLNTQTHVRMYKKGLWDDTFDYNESPYACDYQGRYIIVESEMVVSDAQAACETAGLTLAKVRSVAENEELKAAINAFLPLESEEEWDNSNWVWIGVNDLASAGNFIHNDGEEIPFDIPWKVGQPDHSQTRFGDIVEHYVAVNRGGLWDDSYGEVHHRPFACMCPDS